MAAYQFFNPAPVFFDLLGDDKAAAGSLTFYERGTATPKDTWNSPEQSTLNANPITLDGSGRSPVPIFLDGEYTVACRDSVGAVIWTRDVVPEVSAGTGIPALSPGFLTNDGANLLWQDILLLPDPTGNDGKMLVATGSGYTLQPVPEPEPPTEPEIVITETVTGGTFTAGTSASTTKFYEEWGTGTLPANPGGTTSQVNIPFANTFKTGTKVRITLTPRTVQPGGPVVMYLNGEATLSGFTAVGDVAEGTNASNKMSVATDFDWRAVGHRVVV